MRRGLPALLRPRRAGHRHRPWAAPAVLVCLVAVAACGASTGTRPSADAPATHDLAFSRCMRSHGVPNFPDPSPNGIQIAPGSGINPASPAFESAQRACHSVDPGLSGGPPTISPSERQASVAFSKCMRSHGDPSFPDPMLNPPSGRGPVLALRGMLVRARSGVRTQRAGVPAGGHRVRGEGVLTRRRPPRRGDAGERDDAVPDSAR